MPWLKFPLEPVCLFHVIEFQGVKRLVSLKVVKIEETKVDIQKYHQIISPLTKNE